MAESKATSKPEKNDAPRTASLHAQPPIFNLGKLKKRKRRRLKQGRGTAMGEVHQAINKLCSGGPPMKIEETRKDKIKRVETERAVPSRKR